MTNILNMMAIYCIVSIIYFLYLILKSRYAVHNKKIQADTFNAVFILILGFVCLMWPVIFIIKICGVIAKVTRPE